MVMTMERPLRTRLPQERIEEAQCGQGARMLAARYLGCVSALWRGDPDGHAFGVWLSPFWRTVLPAAPSRSPDAVSPHGAGGRGLFWFETPDAALGYVPGTRCGYEVPREAWDFAPSTGREAECDDVRSPAQRRRA